MPRSRRPGQGYRYSSGGGGKLDLGAILAGLLGGGIEEDPLYASEETIGSKPFDQPFQSDKPFKAKRWWDKPEASAMNAEFNLNKLLGEIGVTNQLKTAQGLTPIEIERQRLLDQVKLDTLRKELPIRRADTNLGGDAAMLNRLNLPSQNLNTYQEAIVPSMFGKIASETLADTATSDLTRQTAEQSKQIGAETFQDLLNATKLNASGGVIKSKNALDLLPLQQQEAIRQLKFAPTQTDIDNAAKLNGIAPAGAMKINKLTGEVEPLPQRPPTPSEMLDIKKAEWMEQMSNRLPGRTPVRKPASPPNSANQPTQGVVNTSVNRPAVSGILESEDGSIVIIDGIRFKRK